MNLSAYWPRFQRHDGVIKGNSEKEKKWNQRNSETKNWIQSNSEKTEFSLNYSELLEFLKFLFSILHTERYTYEHLVYPYRLTLDSHGPPSRDHGRNSRTLAVIIYAMRRQKIP